MITEDERQHVVDEEHLRLLALGYFVQGGIHAAIACFPLIYVVLGAFVFLVGAGSEASAMVVGGIMMAFGLALFLVFIVFGVLQLYAGSCLRHRRHRTFCLVAAGFASLLMPYGTLLGVFTFLVLGRPSVRSLFDPAGARG